MNFQYCFEFGKKYSAAELFKAITKNQMAIIITTANTTDTSTDVEFQLHNNFDELLKGLDDLIKEGPSNSDVTHYGFGYAGDDHDAGEVFAHISANTDHANDYYQNISIRGLIGKNKKICHEHIKKLLEWRDVGF